MSKLGEVIDGKFSQALEIMLDKGVTSVITEKPIMGPAHETIALDCEEGEPNRYVISRPVIDGKPVGINMDDIGLGEVECTEWLAQIPRSLGDRRKMEDLPPEAYKSNIFVVDSNKELIIPMIPGEIVRPLGRRAVMKYTFEIQGLRVVESFTPPEL